MLPRIATYCGVLGGGWRDGILGSVRRELPDDAAPTVLGSQGGQCAECPAQKRAIEGQAGPARHLEGAMRKKAERVFDRFLATYEPKYPKATTCLLKDRDQLLAFYDFPAKHWQSLRTTNPIESTFATIRHRTARNKGCVTRDSLLHMLFKLGQCAERKWRKLRGFPDLAKGIEGVKFANGAEVEQPDRVAA